MSKVPKVDDRLAAVRTYIDARRRQLDLADHLLGRLLNIDPPLGVAQVSQVVDIIAGTPADLIAGRPPEAGQMDPEGARS